METWYTPVAGPVRSFICGWVSAKAVVVLRVPVRPGGGVLCTHPLALGTAMAAFCAAWHGSRLVLCCLARRWLRFPSLTSQRALAGGLAGSLLVLLAPKTTGAHTELHTSTAVAALGVAIAKVESRLGKKLSTCSGALVSVCMTCAASWHLLALFGTAPHLLPTGIRLWLVSLADEISIRSPSLADEISIRVYADIDLPVGSLGVIAAIWRVWRRDATRHLCASAPARLIYAATCASGSSAPVEWRLSPDMSPHGSQPLSACTSGTSAQRDPRCDSRSPLDRGMPRFTCAALAQWLRDGTAAGLAQWLYDGAAAGLVSASFATLLATGPASCERFGWTAGLTLIALRAPPARQFAARLAYQAAFSRAVTFMRGCGAGSQLAAHWLGATILGGSAALLLHEQSRAAAGATDSVLDGRMVRATLFLLGFDEADGTAVGTAEPTVAGLAAKQVSNSSDEILNGDADGACVCDEVQLSPDQ